MSARCLPVLAPAVPCQPNVAKCYEREKGVRTLIVIPAPNAFLLGQQSVAF